MRELTNKETEAVGGGYDFSNIMESFGVGTAAGSTYGIAVHGTVAAASYYGLRTGALGFAWGAGYYLGSMLYDNFGDYIYYKFF